MSYQTYSQHSQKQQFYATYKDILKKIDARAILEHYSAQNVTEEHAKNDGKELLHSCLIHKVKPHHTNGDQNPSAILNTDSMLYLCRSWGGGDILWFIGEMEDCNRFDALDVLAGFVIDTDVPLKSAIQSIKDIYQQGNLAQVPIPKYSKIILEPWGLIHPYMTDDRGLKIETLERFFIGYDERYEQIVIPHFWKGQLVGYQKRRLDSPNWPRSPIRDENGKTIPKYKNSTDFPKQSTLFNYDNIKERFKTITQGKYCSVIVVESVMSVLKAESWFDEGYDWGNTICTFGAKVTDEQLEILREFEAITLFLDHDPAGWLGTVRLYDNLKDYCNVSIIDAPEGKDLADLTLEEAEEVRASKKPGSLVISMYRQRIKEKRSDFSKVQR